MAARPPAAASGSNSMPGSRPWTQNHAARSVMNPSSARLYLLLDLTGSRRTKPTYVSYLWTALGIHNKLTM